MKNILKLLFVFWIIILGSFGFGLGFCYLIAYLNNGLETSLWVYIGVLIGVVMYCISTLIVSEMEL